MDANRSSLKYSQGQLSRCSLWLLFQFKNRSFLSCQQSGAMTSTPSNAVEGGFLDSAPCVGWFPEVFVSVSDARGIYDPPIRRWMFVIFKVRFNDLRANERQLAVYSIGGGSRGGLSPPTFLGGCTAPSLLKNEWLLLVPWSTHHGLTAPFLCKTSINWVSNQSVRFPAFN